MEHEPAFHKPVEKIVRGKKVRTLQTKAKPKTEEEVRQNI
jgi:hypothetical protein